MFSRTDEKHQLYDSTPFIEARKKISTVGGFSFFGTSKVKFIKINFALFFWR
jgi:hypothetical protein